MVKDLFESLPLELNTKTHSRPLSGRVCNLNSELLTMQVRPQRRRLALHLGNKESHRNLEQNIICRVINKEGWLILSSDKK